MLNSFCFYFHLQESPDVMIPYRVGCSVSHRASRVPVSPLAPTFHETLVEESRDGEKGGRRIGEEEEEKEEYARSKHGRVVVERGRR